MIKEYVFKTILSTKDSFYVKSWTFYIHIITLEIVDFKKKKSLKTLPVGAKIICVKRSLYFSLITDILDIFFDVFKILNHST